MPAVHNGARIQAAARWLHATELNTEAAFTLDLKAKAFASLAPL